MIETKYCQIMAQYNEWMNQKLYAVCADIPDADRKKDRGAFFKSIHGTLNHLLFADRVWMGRFTQKPFSGKVMGEELYSDFDDLRQQREITDKEIREWSKNLASEWLALPFKYTSMDKKTRVVPTEVLVLHMFNHQTHHRGQLTTLLSQLGRDPGITDLPWLPSLNELSVSSQDAGMNG